MQAHSHATDTCVQSSPPGNKPHNTMGSLRVMHVFYTKRTLSVPNCTEQSDRSAGLAASDRRIGGASSDPEGHALGYYVVGKRTRTFSYVDVRRTLAATSTRRLTPPDWTESHNMRTLQAAGPSVSEASRHAEFRKRTSLNAVSRLDYRTQYLHAHATLCYRMCW